MTQAPYDPSSGTGDLPPEPTGRGFLDVRSATGAQDDDVDDSHADDTEPSSFNLLGDLGKQRAKLAEHLYIDLRVPGWGEDPEEQPRVSIYVRCRPLRPSEAETIRTKRRKGGKAKDDWIDFANADTIITACLEVWAQSGDPLAPEDCPEDQRLSLRPGDLYGEKTRLDGNLADALGMSRGADGKPPTAVQIVRFLFLHDGNLARAVVHLMDHSNMGAERESADF